MKAYKLVRILKDGSLAPLFIDKKRRLPMGEFLQATNVPTKGYATRPGWHCLARPIAPHLSTKGRVWVEVEMSGYIRTYSRPESQGGIWYTAEQIKINKLCPNKLKTKRLS